jgi:hypothetical protein
MKREEAINKVNEGIGSIYTKEDVINLINQIEDTQVEAPSFDGEPIVKAVMDIWNQSVQDIFNDLQSEIEDNRIVNMNDCEFDLEFGNKVVLNDISFDSYEIEDKIEKCRDAVAEFVSKAIVDACTPEEDEDTLTDDDKIRIEEGFDHKG